MYPSHDGRLCHVVIPAFTPNPSYKDCHMTNEMWMKEKMNMDKFMFGQMPQITMDGGKCLVQCDAIMRYPCPLYFMNSYLGKEMGYYGTTPMECAQIDMIMGCCAVRLCK